MSVTASGVAPATSTIVGMSILQGESMADAMAMVDNHHHLRWAEGCEILVLEEMQIPEMAETAN